MSESSKIEWCDSTFNPWEGCTKVGPGCDHCYAENRNARFGGGESPNWGPGAPRRRTSVGNWNGPKRWNARSDEFRQCDICGWRGERKPRWAVCQNCKNGLMQPTRRRVFCASLADWLDNEVPIEWLTDLLDLIRLTPNLNWLLLSKRIGNWRGRLIGVVSRCTGWDVEPRTELREWLQKWLKGTAPANTWLGATVVNQAEADRDIPKLLQIPARVRFLSMEPLLGPVDLRVAFTGHCPEHDFPGGFCLQRHHEGVQHLHWVIAGGESGPHARVTHPDCFRSLRDQCAAAGVPFLFKQWGEWWPGERGRLYHARTADFTDGQPMVLAGKKAAGRMLDGVEHNGFPANAEPGKGATSG